MTEPKYIYFRFEGYSKTGKTKHWKVYAKEDDTLLGEIGFDAAWWSYDFYPAPNMKFEKHCMRDIADFCEEQEKLWRQHNRELMKGLKEITDKILSNT